MEMMRHIAKNLKTNKLNLYIYLAVPFILLIQCFIFGVPELSKFNSMIKNNNEIVYNFIYFLMPCILLIVIYIWFYYAPIYYKNIIELQSAFKWNDQYASLYKKYIGWIKQFDLNGNAGVLFIKIGFCLFWFWGLGYLYYCLFGTEILPRNLKVLPLLFLHVIISVLNFSSYYLCISFIFFIKKVSELDLKYNKFLPSTTYGFQLLRKNSNTIYVFFLLDSLGCTILYIALMYIHGIGNENLRNFDGKFLFMTFYVGILGLGSCFGIAIFISHFLKKIYNKWKDEALYNFHTELLEVEKIYENDKDSKIRDLAHIIEKLQHDKISISRQEIIISIIVGIVNLIAAIIPIIYQIL